MDLRSRWLATTPPFSIEVYNEEAEKLFPAVIARMRQSGTASVFCLDQFGVTFVNQTRFMELVNTPRSDTLFFLASSYVHRFAEDFAPFFGVPAAVAATVEADRMHNKICDTLAELLPNNDTAFLSGYALHKGANHYGLVFLTHNGLGLQKFVEACWACDPNSGSSNRGKHRTPDLSGDLFSEEPLPTDKYRQFVDDLETFVTSRRALTEKEVVLFTYKRGMLGRHAKPTLISLKKDGVITSACAFSYSTVSKRTVFLK